MWQATSILTGIGVGAGLMYFFDPQRGRQRRTLLNDQMQSGLCQAQRALDVTWRDLSNRTYGTFAEMSSAFSEHDNSNPVVEARVRSKLGRLVSHPHAIRVHVNDGQVTLSGPILEHEVSSLVTCIRSITGVRSVKNNLDEHEHAGNISALQGGHPRTGEQYDLLQSNWSPTTKLLVGSLATCLTLYGTQRRSPVYLTLGALGLGLLSSAFAKGSPASGAAGEQRHESDPPNQNHHKEHPKELVFQPGL